jgi:AcrR family transcriptional regulator
VFGEPRGDWVGRRRAVALDAIVTTAWDLARENGLAGLSLRDLARRLGMAPASLYSYVDSKNDLYDAMFAHGYRALLALEPPSGGGDVRTVLRKIAHHYVTFSVEDPVRFQLLSQRTIPGFEPSPAAYALAQEAYEVLHAPLRAVVDVTQEDLDLLTALISGIVSQQVANDPGGTRWVRLLDDAVELIVPRLEQRNPRTAPKRGNPTSRKESHDTRPGGNAPPRAHRP